MEAVMNQLWGQISHAQANGLSQFNSEHDGSHVQVNIQKTGWYEGYY